MSDRLFNPEQVEWLINHYGLMDFDRLRYAFNAAYGTSFERKQFVVWFKNHRRKKKSSSNPNTMTLQKIQWLRDHVNDCSRRKLTEKMNEAFRCHNTLGTVNAIMKKNGIKACNERAMMNRSEAQAINHTKPIGS